MVTALHVRAATAADLPQIAAIYDEQVAASVSTFDVEPRPRSVWEQRLASTEPGDRFLVAVESGPASPAAARVLGYAATTAYRPKPAYAHTREVSVYVAAGARRRGVARALYDALLPMLRADGVHLVVAVIALPNEASEAVHAAYGFVRAGVLPQVGRKFDRWVDTAVLTLLLTGA